MPQRSAWDVPRAAWDVPRTAWDVPRAAWDGAMVRVDWSRFGLSSEPARRPSAAEPSAGDPLAGAAQQDDELFADEQVGCHISR